MIEPVSFARYQLRRKLPGGGMGRVYYAWDGLGDRPVAIKFIDHGADPESLEIVEAERRGAILQEKLCAADQRVACIYEWGDHDGYFYIAMEYVEGKDLSELLAGGPVGFWRGAEIARDICAVLDSAHTLRAEIDGHEYRGIVHGDIKPRNIRVTPEGSVKLLDFGIAKALSMTRKFTQNLFGSAQYMSPERLNTGEVDAASDLWSVAVVLYEMAVGKPYFQTETLTRLEHSIRTYASVRPLPADLPDRFQAILRKALSPDPGRRYSTARAFQDDLAAFREGRPVVAESEPQAEIEATRRTTPAPDEVADERTRRTSPVVAKPVKTAGPLTPSQIRKRNARTALKVAALALMVWFGFSQYDVWRDGAALQRELEVEQLKDLDAAWKRYAELEDRAHLPFILYGARAALKQRMIAFADRAIAEYRNSDVPLVREGDWKRAHAALAQTLRINPRDNEVKGKLRLAEGHIERIEAAVRPSARQWNEARTRFEEARDLLRQSPDPYLGLARVYAYGYRDVERTDDAIRQAEKRGHEPGRREKAQLAHVYFARAEQMIGEAGKAAGTAREKDFLHRALEDLERSERQYEEIVPFGEAAERLEEIQQLREEILLQLDPQSPSGKKGGLGGILDGIRRRIPGL